MSNVGRFAWYELLTPDAEAAKSFYGSVMGWKSRPWEAGDQPYSMWMVGETPVGGLMEWHQEGMPPAWWAYVTVTDVDAAAKRAEELGGRILKPGGDIPEVGRFAIIADPQGATITLFTPKGEPMPPTDRMKPGNVGWHELNTTDNESAWTFYSALFGWKQTTSLDMGPEWGSYLMFRHPDDPEDASLGGMFNAAKVLNLPAHWLYYVVVDEMDATLERVKAAGGKVVNGPNDVPGGGRATRCMDPQGAHFALFAMK